MIELLRPLVGLGPNGTSILNDTGDRIDVTNDLAIALEWVGRPEEALRLYCDAMKSALNSPISNYLVNALSNWSDGVQNMNGLARAERANSSPTESRRSAGFRTG